MTTYLLLDENGAAWMLQSRKWRRSNAVHLKQQASPIGVLRFRFCYLNSSHVHREPRSINHITLLLSICQPTASLLAPLPAPLLAADDGGKHITVNDPKIHQGVQIRPAFSHLSRFPSPAVSSLSQNQIPKVKALTFSAVFPDPTPTHQRQLHHGRNCPKSGPSPLRALRVRHQRQMGLRDHLWYTAAYMMVSMARC